MTPGRPKPYSYHVAEQLAREASMSADTTAVEDSIAARYLAASRQGEVQRATDLALRIRHGTQDQAVMALVKEQRGSNLDILLQYAAQGGAYLVGKAISEVSPHAAFTALPALAGMIASLAVPAHYGVRSGIAGATASYIAGAASKKETP